MKDIIRWCTSNIYKEKMSLLVRSRNSHTSSPANESDSVGLWRINRIAFLSTAASRHCALSAAECFIIERDGDTLLVNPYDPYTGTISVRPEAREWKQCLLL